MRVSRWKGSTHGLLLVILGLWGALVPFIAPYFDFGFGPDRTWFWQNSRLWMNVLPGAAVVLGGLVLMGMAGRVSLAVGAWLAVLGGAWFVVGPQLSRLWNHGVSLSGVPMGGSTQQVLEYIAFYVGLGAVILAVGAMALGRVSVVSAHDAAWADARDAEARRAAAPEGVAAARGREDAAEEPTAGRGRGRRRPAWPRHGPAHS